MINTQLGRDRWPSVIGPVDSRAELLRALDAYRRGVAGAPVVCKGSPGMPRIGESAPSVNAAGSHTRHSPVDGIPSEGAPLTVVASTDDADRHGDTVALDGWQLDNYRRNPVLLWAHDYGRPPIGRASEVWRDGHALVARMEFAPTRGSLRKLRGCTGRGISVPCRWGSGPCGSRNGATCEPALCWASGFWNRSYWR